MESILNVTDLGEDWYSGTNSLGQTGLFPGNYVQIAKTGNDFKQPENIGLHDSTICAVALVSRILYLIFSIIIKPQKKMRSLLLLETRSLGLRIHQKIGGTVM